MCVCKKTVILGLVIIHQNVFLFITRFYSSGLLKTPLIHGHMCSRLLKLLNLASKNVATFASHIAVIRPSAIVGTSKLHTSSQVLSDSILSPASCLSVPGNNASVAVACRAPFLKVDPPLVTQVRGRAQIYYQPSAWKRVNKHGIERRLLTQGGIEVLWRRFLKRRHVLAPFERILPGTVQGKILPKEYLKQNQHLINKDLFKGIKFSNKKVKTIRHY